MDTLINILSMRREHDSEGELNFIGQYLTPAVMRNKYGAKWNRRVHKSLIPSRATLNIMVKDMVNTRLEYKPVEYVSHRKTTIDIIM